METTFGGCVDGKKPPPSLSVVMYSSRAKPAAQYGSDIWSRYVCLMENSGIACLFMHGKMQVLEGVLTCTGS